MDFKMSNAYDKIDKRLVKLSGPDSYGVSEYEYPFPLTHCQKNYLNELQLDPSHSMRDRFTKDMRELSYDYDFQHCLNPRVFAFLITWQRIKMFIAANPISIEIINFLRNLARNEVALSTDSIPKGSILGEALIALDLDTEYKLTDDHTK
jgi:hypothetical protein